jgi:hypothetical protein
MLKKTKLKLASALLIAGVSASSYAVWMNAQTIVYYTDSSMSQVSGYKMYYCQSMARILKGKVTNYKRTLVGGSCQSGGVPPSPY